MSARPARLALADGTVVAGTSVGAAGEAAGELCFNTSMSGYQEILTDPSYAGQLMMMTYPHIGNYGAFEAATEADRPHVAGLIVRAFARHPSNSAMEETLDAYMARHGLVGITGVDTRRLVRHVREAGVMNAVVSTDADASDADLVARAAAHPSMAGLELASRVTTAEAYDVSASGRPRIAVVRLRRQAPHPAPVRRPGLRRARLPGRRPRSPTCSRGSRTASSSPTAPATRAR